MTTDLVRGPWIHYKGGRYLVAFVAETHEHNGDLDVVYISLTHGKVVTRPLRRDSRDQDSWQDMIRWPDGMHRERFVPEDSLAPFERAELERGWRAS